MSTSVVTGTDMVEIPGGTFRMGSDAHYPEERPVHRVTVDGFRMDPYPVTNARFRRFVETTGHVTFAELVPDPKDYPGALPEMLYASDMARAVTYNASPMVLAGLIYLVLLWPIVRLVSRLEHRLAH